jgi:hypothetical protein
MHFAKFRWLNSFSRQLMAAYAGGVVLIAGLILAGLFTLFLFQGRLFSQISISEYAETIGEQLQFDSTGEPVSVELPQMSWLFDSLGREVTYRVLSNAGTVVLSSEAGAGPLTGTGEKLVLEQSNFDFERQGIAMHGPRSVWTTKDTRGTCSSHRAHGSRTCFATTLATHCSHAAF